MPDGDVRSRVRLSFTSLSLGYSEFCTVCDIFAETRTWTNTLEEVRTGNLLQRPSAKSAQRIFGEIRKRIECLSDETIATFPSAPDDDRRAIAYLAACKLYPLIFDFVRFVLLEKIAVFDFSVSDTDFDGYWNRKAIDHHDLETVTAKTQEKARQNVFKLLLEAGLLTDKKDPRITPTSISHLIESILENEGSEYRHAFLIQ